MAKSIRLGFTLLIICIGAIYAATINGTVTDSISGTPINGVRVSLRLGNQTRASDTTNTLGVFVFENVDTGSYTIRTSIDGYTTKSVPVAVAGTTPVPVTIPVVKIITSTVSGKITDSISGDPLSGAIVRLGNNTYDTTGADGLYLFANVTSGNQALRASMSGYTTKNITATVGADPLTLNIALVKVVTTTISGKITDSISGDPLSGAIVRLGNNTYDTTGADGLYSFANVTSGNQALRATMSGYATKNITATTGATPITLNIALVKVVTTTVSGKISDSTSGNPLSGAIVRLGNNTYDTTGADGLYSFSNVTSGNQSIRVSMNGYVTKNVTAAVGADPLTLNISLVKMVTATVSGKVTDSTSGAPIGNAIVRLGNTTSDTTGPDGLYSFANVPTGNQSIRVTLTGYASKTVSVSVTSSEPVTQNIALVKLVTTTISGKVTDSISGAAITGAVVRIGFTGGQSDTTGADGTYSISNVTTGNQMVSVSRSGYTSKTSTANVTDATPVTVNFALTVAVTATVSGVVTDSATGVKISGAVVRVGSGMNQLSDTTDSNGSYSIANVSSGAQSIRVTISGYNTKTVNVTISNSNPVTQNIAITKRATAAISESVKPRIPNFSISNGILNMTNINNSGKLTLFGLNGSILYQSVFESGHSQIILPKISKSVFIATITTEGRTLTRTILPIKN